MLPDIQVILVPQGAEHRAVCGGLRKVLNPPAVFPIPVGAVPVAHYLERLQQANCLQPQQRVLVMGLCGSLTPDLAIGDRVLYDSCIASHFNENRESLECDRQLNDAIQKILENPIKSVTAVTSDRVISRAAEKQHLAQQCWAQTVDMEGFPILQMLSKQGMAVAMLRVVSDDSHHDIPNLAGAFDVNGSLKPFSLATAMLKQPIAACRLIYGSTKSLKILQNLTTELYKNSF